MRMRSKVSLHSLNRADEAAFIATLGDIYEHAPWVAQAVSGNRPFATLAALQAAMTAAVQGAPADRHLGLIRAHPDLAGKAARAGSMSRDSQAEQASAGLDRLAEAELAEFHRLNAAYRGKFDMPFIICVRRHGKDSILRQFERRLDNDSGSEVETALAEIFRIVALRLDERIEADDKLPVHGRLSTHVLDTHGGCPGAGIAIELDELSESAERRAVSRGITNRDGRTEAPLIEGRPLPIGRYELRFRIGEYFAARSLPLADPRFLDVVPVVFAIAEPEGHYHVPLLVTPWSYTTYRGS
jgi:2-oxo-4-hydroxy-4-carboxy-5-ureidoimidazoline decarboxylase